MAANGTGWGGVFSAYPIRKLGKGCILPGISLIISILAYYFGSVNDPIMLMAKIADPKIRKQSQWQSQLQ